MDAGRESPPDAEPAWKTKLFEIIFEADTRTGKLFDVVLLALILISLLVVMLESVDSIDARHHELLYATEWAITILFSIEYVLRLVCVRKPTGYAFSFFGIVDLLSIVPTYLSLLAPDYQVLLVIRSLRLLRLFRVLKLVRFVSEGAVLRRALWESRAKITVFLTVVLIVVTIMGALMHLVEGEEAGFTSIPQSMYWAVVTVTTVGYGDIAPVQPLGKLLAAMCMVIGYSLIIVPTGIISAEIVRLDKAITTQSCQRCARQGHDPDATHCKYCGEAL